MLENLSAREAATVQLNTEYGIRSVGKMSKKAFNGDEIFGNEYGFRGKN